MARIHPTAIIDSSAELGEGVEIGPYCVIGAEVELADGCVLHSHVVLSGPSKIGRNNIFYPHGCIGGRTQDLKYAGEPTYLEIGDHNIFREHVTVNRSDSAEDITRIGSHGNFLAYSHIAHDCKVGDHVIFSNNGTLAGHVTVEDHVILGGLTAVHQFCRIGAHAITGGCSKIIQDIPPYLIADGNPATIRGVNKIGLERHGMPEEVRTAIAGVFRTLYRSGLNTSQAIEQLRAENTTNLPEVTHLITFIENSERGITRGK
jgi:UDP-N-acetylglucosamine acyltransferase